MKSNLRIIAIGIISAGLLTTGLLAPTLHAQSNTAYAQVVVPFSFDYGTTHFGAGTYIIDTTRSNVMMLRGRDHQVALVFTHPEYARQSVKASHVVFEKYGDRFFLTEVWTASRSTYLTVYESEAEKHAARAMASRGTSPGRVEEALLIAPHASSGN